ncbi:S53 family peptidase [Edaphobacter aggregans]|uniref:S53 family peptidase n=1 Tax=Edaphobacter aggregans TaxID=570835 RepID=UPI00068EFE17|nr:S53 family peptidase [Edaphobacter aggregans]
MSKRSKSSTERRQARFIVNGFHHTHFDEADHAGAIDPDQPLAVTLLLTRRKPLAHSGRQLTRDDIEQHHSVAPADAARVRAFASRHGLSYTPHIRHHATATLTGPAHAIARAFRINLVHFDHPDCRYLAPTNTPTIPSSIEPVVEAIFGLQTRPAARRAPTRTPHPTTDLTLPQLADIYSFPPNTDGAGQTIGLLELGGGFRLSDIRAFCRAHDLPVPRITVVELNARNSPASPIQIRKLLDFVAGRIQLTPKRLASPAIEAAQATVEVTMDIEILAALAPAAHIVVYFSSSDEQGFYRAITHAIHDPIHRPDVLSISWGEPETAVSRTWLRSVNEAFRAAARLGITVLASSGDAGALNNSPDNLPAVNFPASSPFAIACGGTTPLSHTPAREEIVWNDKLNGISGATGGGVSRHFPLPPWQRNSRVPLGPTGKPGRGVPDVAGPADPRHGSPMLIAGVTCATAGTSAVVPLWAALIARLNQSLQRRIGHINPRLYHLAEVHETTPASPTIDLAATASPRAFQPVTRGHNGAYKARPGWNPCAGHGTLHGESLLTHLRAPFSHRRNSPATRQK